MLFTVTEHSTKTARHGSFYLASGPEAGPLIIFIHGWPELSHSRRHQLRCFGALGFHCAAPDMRGYSRSSIYSTHAGYALEHSVHDMLDLLTHIGRDRAIWVANGFAPADLIALVNREIYLQSACPAGQWEYQLFTRKFRACPLRVRSRHRKHCPCALPQRQCGRKGETLPHCRGAWR